MEQRVCTTKGSGDSLQGLSDRLDARREELEQTALARMRAIADPHAAPDPAYLTGLRAALAAGLEYSLSAVAAPTRQPDPVPIELLAQARLAARNRVTLDAVVRRCSAGHTLLADALLEEAAAFGLGAADLRAAMRALAVRHERIVEMVSEEFEREASAEGIGTERQRYLLLRRLLAGEPLDPSSLSYQFEGHHLALVAAGQDVALEVARLGEHVDRRLLLVEADTQLAWAWLGGRRSFSCEEVDLVASHPWPPGCAVACGEPGRGLAGWRLSHRQAAVALPVARRGEEAVVHYGEVALLAAALQDDLVASTLRRGYLDPLNAERDNGVAAKQTLRAYFRASRNVSSAAAALGVPRSTVRSRLRGVEGRLGHSLDMIAAELELALRLDDLEAPSGPL
jgi:hypothetical protein